MRHKVLKHIGMAGVIMLLATGCGPLAALPPTPTATGTGITVTGIADKVMAEDGFIVLAAPTDGVSILWFTPDSQLLNSSGADIVLESIESGARLQATGWTQGSDIMVVDSLAALGDADLAVAAPQAVLALDRSITLLEPLEGATVANPAHIRGIVSVTPLENTLRGRVYNEQGQVVGEAPIAVAGTLGGLGTFDVHLGFDVVLSGPGTVEIAEISVHDGSIVVSAVAAVNLPMPEEIIISGSVAQVLPSAMMIHLTEVIHGFSTIALQEDTALLSITDAEVGLLEIEPGMEIEARGQPGESGALIARQVRVIDTYPQQIVLVTPKAGDTIAEEIRLLGSVRLTPSETKLIVRIVDPEGQVILESPLAVNGQPGSPGVFSTAIAYDATYSGPASIEIVEQNAQSGGVLSKSTTNVYITAASGVTIVAQIAEIDYDAGTVRLTESVGGADVVVTNAATLFYGVDGTRIALSDIQPGATVQIFGQAADGTWMASELRVSDG
ncbi:MAG: hypothetical protein GX620_01685 [Chloroflexi bacterium]|nr:hypothetical protein [Chloroflexota bacterium]